MGSCAVGAAIVMSGVLLAQIEESEDDLKLTKEEGSWFGMVYIFQNISRYYIFHTPLYTPLTRPILELFLLPDFISCFTTKSDI